MWNEKTKPLVESGKLVVIGIVQEQHAERARLYKQWKNYEFPIAQDALTSLGLAVVPVPVLLDEFGFVISTRPRPSEIAKLVDQKSPNSEKSNAKVLDAESLDAKSLLANVNAKSTSGLVAIGDRYFFENSTESLQKAIGHYKDAINQIKQSDSNVKTLLGSVHFRLGVAYRALYDNSETSHQNPEHFNQAAANWSKALALNPNQYIWRRRIQQYGPRQIKPYPFYNWVDQAISEIKERGQTPVKLHVSLTEAETAMPRRTFDASTTPKSPDPEGAITRDTERIVSINPTVVPQGVKAGEAVRVHLRFSTQAGHWNNEAEPMKVYLEDSDFGRSSASLLSHKNAENASSDEIRNVEFEFQTAKQASETIKLRGYALYYVCKDRDGQCLYRRQDFEIPVELKQ